MIGTELKRDVSEPLKSHNDSVNAAFAYVGLYC